MRSLRENHFQVILPLLKLSQALAFLLPGRVCWIFRRFYW